MFGVLTAMSEDTTTSRANKIRLNVTISPAAVEAAKKLAAEENRSMSNMIEVLLDRAIRKSEAATSAAVPAPQEVAA